MKQHLTKYIPLMYGVYFNMLAVVAPELAAKRAFSVFCTPRKGQILPNQQTFLERAKHQVIATENYEVFTYKWPGDRETILLLHGWESNSFRWHKLISKLCQEGFNIIAMDAPAHGKSTGNSFNVPLYVEGINEVVKQFEPNYIVAHSVGGMAALYHQYKYPENSLQKIVSLGAPSEFSDLMRQYKAILQFNNKVADALNRLVHKKFGFQIKEFSTAAFARSIDAAGLLIHDELDTIAPYWASEQVHANWKNSTLIKTNGLGHSMHQDQVGESILNFLNS